MGGSLSQPCDDSKSMSYKIYIVCVVLVVVAFDCSKCFQCPDYIIPRKDRCDGINNCGDNSDEEGCPNSQFFEEEDETIEDELLSQIAELEKKLSEAELAKQDAENQLIFQTEND